MSHEWKPPRVAPLTRAQFPADRIAVYDHIVETRKLGHVGSMFAMMGHSPGALQAVASVGEHVRFHSVLSNDLVEIVICTVSRIVGNRYEWCHHIHRVPDALRSAVGTREIEAQPAPIGPAVTYARLLAEGETVDDALLEEIRETLGDEGLVDLTVMVGYYQLLGTFCTVLNVPLDAGVEDAPF